ncbi:hypothetical protein PHMEG_00017950 [Phytophthora megakarya]|uniref:Integrase catalytic domain-containing protein n=1 Tax=Phytophthora megakarya TaxID=4795 RepID=A0A225VWS7_9STRA|nr:hypothetical protein PHMEG_00017950 [Phytophthora megakarya]
MTAFGRDTYEQLTHSRGSRSYIGGLDYRRRYGDGYLVANSVVVAWLLCVKLCRHYEVCEVETWDLDVAGLLHATDGGERYVIAVDHTTKDIAAFLMKQVVLRFGPFREILTDGALELVGKVIEELVVLLQTQQRNSVPYLPQMIGPV